MSSEVTKISPSDWSPSVQLPPRLPIISKHSIHHHHHFNHPDRVGSGSMTISSSSQSPSSSSNLRSRWVNLSRGRSFSHRLSSSSMITQTHSDQGLDLNQQTESGSRRFSLGFQTTETHPTHLITPPRRLRPLSWAPSRSNSESGQLPSFSDHSSPSSSTSTTTFNSSSKPRTRSSLRLSVMSVLNGFLSSSTPPSSLTSNSINSHDQLSERPEMMDLGLRSLNSDHHHQTRSQCDGMYLFSSLIL